MSLPEIAAVRNLAASLDRLDRLYRQLHHVPQEIQDIFRILGRCRQLLAKTADLIGHGQPVPAIIRQEVDALEEFRVKLLDLQLFIDPEQSLHHSGLGNGTDGSVLWDSTDHGDVEDFCELFQPHASNAEAECKKLWAKLSMDNDSAHKTFPPLFTQYTPANPSSFTGQPPFHGAFAEASVPSWLQQRAFDFRSPSPFSLTAPGPPDNRPIIPASTFTLPRPSSSFDFQARDGETWPSPDNSLYTLSPLSEASDSSPRRRRVRSKTRATRRIVQLLEEYNKPVAGVKRTYSERDAPTKSYVRRRGYVERDSAMDFSLSPPLSSPTGMALTPLSEPPTLRAEDHQPAVAPESPQLNPNNGLDRHPSWSLDELVGALPPVLGTGDPIFQKPAIPDRNPLRNPQPIRPHIPVLNMLDAELPWSSSNSSHSGSLYSGSLYSGSSAASIRSSLREGSITSPDSDSTFTYSEGACKLWYRQGTLRQLPIASLEIRRQPRLPPAGAGGGNGTEGVAIVARTTSGQEVVDDLWMASAQINSSPFLEHAEIVGELRRRDAGVRWVVRLAPNTARHPQYSFATREEAIELMQAIAGKRLVSSVDVESIKSACTHGNAEEAGCETLQIWEEADSAQGDGSPGRTRRTIRFFRNKNAAVSLPTGAVVAFDVNWFRVPERERRTGKLTFAFRDGQFGMSTALVRDMKYLKVSFSSDAAKEEFLREAGFAGLV